MLASTVVEKKYNLNNNRNKCKSNFDNTNCTLNCRHEITKRCLLYCVSSQLLMTTVYREKLIHIRLIFLMHTDAYCPHSIN